MLEERDFYSEVGRRVRQSRLESGLTQKALAERVSLSRASITNVESGRQKLLLHTLAEIAYALRVAPADLMPPVGARPERPLGDLLSRRPDAERAWIGAALSSLRLEGPA